MILSNTSREGCGLADKICTNFADGILSVMPQSSPKKGAQIPILIQ